MKKTFLTCMAVVALLAIASGAGAITCTIDQRPAATLLIPYFQATFNLDGSICGGVPCTDPGAPAALDTLVTIGNASTAPMLAHVAVWSERSELVLDFNIALTGFDIQSFSVAQILHGNLPNTPINKDHESQVKDSHQVTVDGDVCQKADGAVYPAPGGYLRIGLAQITAPASSFDNGNATTVYTAPAFPPSFLFSVLDSLDTTPDSNTCGGEGVDNVIANPIHGYITIDHVNYCTLSNPDQASYWTQDAAGFENNLFGDYIFINSTPPGVGTFGLPAVAIEADPSLADNTAVPSTLTGIPGRRTFYRRYVQAADTLPCANAMPLPQSAWDCGFGDQREPLGLKYAARYLDSGTLSSSFNVWRASSVVDTLGLVDLLGPFSSGVAKCTAQEPTVALTFFDEDENVNTFGCTFSPCGTPSTFNFPLETQRVSISTFRTAHPPGNGWVSMEFFNSSGPLGGTLDQAYVTYDFQGPGAFLSAGFPAAQLDPTNCQPLLVPCTDTQPSNEDGDVGGPGGPCVSPSSTGVTTTAPAIPLVVGTGP